MDFFEDIGIIFSTPEYIGYIFQGFGSTLAVMLIAAAIGLVLGFLVAVVKIAATNNKLMRIPAFICNVYTTVIRGTPMALQLFLFVFAIFAIPGFKPPAAILAFGFNSGAYVSESIRAGILSVDKGQMEAGRSLGMTWTQTMFRIIFPQAIKNVIPAVGNEMIALLKETSIIGWVGATVGTLTFDLNAAAGEIAKRLGGSYLAPTIVTGCLYLVVVYAMVVAIKIIERRLRASDRR